VNAPAPEAWVVYDGDCPLCRNYVHYYRLRDSVGVLHLVDAREGGPVVDEVRAAGLDLDKGMAMKLGGRLYHGADCVHALALMGTRAGWFNRANAWVFQSPRLTRWLYPLLKAGRRSALWVTGKGLIGDGSTHPPATPCAGGTPPASRP
jgi:predicted DCC family thiol-disulfide oxidoreductase YuxK